MRTKTIFILLAFILPLRIFAQDDLLDMLDEEEETTLVTSAFMGTHIINGHSTKTKGKGALDFLIYHRFGPVNSGIDEFFGLDQANMRLGFEYGISDVFDLGIGRSTYEKTYDGYLKWKFIRQQTGGRGGSSFNMVFFSSIAIGTNDTGDDVSTSDRMGYTFEFLISRKFGRKFTLQIMPGLVHLNAVPAAIDKNDIYFTGIAFRYKLTPSVALTGEYYYRFNPLQSIETYDAIGIGVDIETGGHVFQLHFTNARPTFEKGFITDTRDNFWDGDIRFGFNISRTFQLK